MSGGVGVLAALDLSPENVRVLREYARDTGSFRVTKQGATNLAAACAAALKAAEARDAVAELIEAATELRARQRDYLSQPKGERVEAKGRLVGVAATRLDAALARVQGGAA